MVTCQAPASAEKAYREKACIFFLGQINISVKFMFLITVRSRTEIFAIQLVTKVSNLITLSLYRDPSGEVNEFQRRLNAALKYLYIHNLSL
jgi:hypothetical protein